MPEPVYDYLVVNPRDDARFREEFGMEAVTIPSGSVDRLQIILDRLGARGWYLVASIDGNLVLAKQRAAAEKLK